MKPDIQVRPGEPQQKEPAGILPAQDRMEHPVTEREDILFQLEDLLFEEQPEIFSGPEDTLIIASRRPAGSRSDPERQMLHVIIYDPMTASVLARRDLQPDAYVVDSVFSDGTFAVCDDTGSTYSFYDLELNLKATYCPPKGTSGCISHDRKYYYYADSGLRRDSVEGKGSEFLELPCGLPVRQVTAIHPRQDLLWVIVDTDPYQLSSAFALVDLGTLDLCWLNARWVGTFNSRDSICFLSYNADTDQLVCPLEGWEICSVLFFAQKETAQLIGIPDSRDFLYWTRRDGTDVLELIRMGKDDRRADLTPYSDQMQGTSYLGYEPLDCIFFDAQTENGFCIQCLNCRSLKLKTVELGTVGMVEDMVDNSLIARYQGMEAPQELRGSLEYLKQGAQMLEEEYRVGILLSGQCREVLARSYYKAQTTDELPETEELSLLQQSLACLSHALGTYPPDFFPQFADESRGVHGIRFLLVASIESSNDIMAFEYFQDGWFNVVFDVTRTASQEANLYHELWHATEDRAIILKGVWVNESVWDSFNPEGFAYSGAYESFQDADDSDTFLDARKMDSIYFVDNYSKIYSKEDRARVMEFAIAYPYMTETMHTSEALLGKLQYLCDFIRQTMDGSAWTERAPWERYAAIQIYDPDAGIPPIYPVQSGIG
ncbi:MAG: hypothetical protein J6P31_06660 [Oscillospiraceae bacterium]|nr:hypothetical protein [Oscillospiraceae bacterium]